LPNAAEPAAATRLRVGGLQRFSSIDFPGHLAAVVFCQGCPWRCSYCHNPELLDAKAAPGIAWDAVLAFLAQRKGLLDGVVFSGGEPTLQAGLADAIAQVRRLGFAVALHTGGMYPQRLAAVLPQVDWVGLDVKAPWHRMDALTGTRGSAERVTDSLQLVAGSGVAFECRTTWDPSLFPVAELHTLSEELAGFGVRAWALQQCRGEGRRGGAPAAHDLALFASRFDRFEVRAG
jgi:pyruvate formate lyase activating enzyme